jgi:uncharacterized membrane protein YvbJ
MYCSKCGTESANNAEFCSKCGQAHKEFPRPPVVEIGEKTYTRGELGGKYEAWYSCEGKWFSIENGKAVRQGQSYWGSIHWSVQTFLVIGVLLLSVIILCLFESDFNLGIKTLIGIDVAQSVNNFLG